MIWTPNNPNYSSQTPAPFRADIYFLAASPIIMSVFLRSRDQEFIPCCVKRRPYRFFNVTRCLTTWASFHWLYGHETHLENLSSGENLAGWADLVIPWQLGHSFCFYFYFYFYFILFYLFIYFSIKKERKEQPKFGNLQSIVQTFVTIH